MTEITRVPENGSSRGPGKATSGRRRGRRHGLEIRPGSVKQARALAGLSLGQVAREDISRTAIYFVETGKAKPSRETLELIAQRTGQPLDFFLSGAGGLDQHPAARIAELERLLVTGDNAGVVAAAQAALTQEYDAESEARIKLLASMAYLRQAQPVQGRRLAVAARTYFDRVSNVHMAAEALGHEAQAAGLLQDPSAVQIAEGALATCRTLRPVPQVLEARLLRVLGHQLVNTQRWKEAIACYEEAVVVGDVVQDLQQLSLLYSGMSAAHQEIGQINEATRYAQKALTIHETLRDRLSQARSLNNLGWMLVGLGEFAAARSHLARALRIFEEQRWDVVPGAESSEAFAGRMRGVVERIAAAHPDQRVAVFAHGGVIGEILRQTTDSRPFAFVGADNGSISHIVITDERWILRRFNDTSHLQPAMTTRPEPLT